MSYVDDYYQKEIPGCLLLTQDTLMGTTNMGYLDGYYEHELSGLLFANVR